MADHTAKVFSERAIESNSKTSVASGDAIPSV